MRRFALAVAFCFISIAGAQSFWQSRLQVSTGGGGGGGGCATTLNSADAAAGLTFSNGDLTVTSTGAPYKNVRATSSQTMGKWYWEIISSQGFAAAVGAVGLANSFASLTTYIGSDTNSEGYFPGAGGGIFYNNGPLLSWAANYTPGDPIGIAEDLTHSLIWFRRFATDPYNNNALADPDTGVGGIPFSPTGAVFPAISLDGNGDNATVNFGGPFIGAKPTTFLACP